MNEMATVKSKSGKSKVEMSLDLVYDMWDAYGVDSQKMVRFLLNGAEDAGNQGEFQLNVTWVSNSLRFELAKKAK